MRTRRVLVKRVGRWLFDREKVGRGRAGSEQWGGKLTREEEDRIAGVVAERNGELGVTAVLGGVEAAASAVR